MTEPRTSPLLLIPGPTPVSPAVLEALARPTESHSSPTTAAAMRAMQEGLREAVGASADALVLAIAGSGTLALEVALCNVVRPGDTLLVVNHGYFGDRFAAVGRALGTEVVEVSCPWGQQVPAAAVDQALTQTGARVMTVTHVDTATGVTAQFEQYAEVARHHGALMVLDSVAGAGGMPVGMSRLGIDVLVTASQKALAAPPGLALLVVSDRALEHRRQLSGSGTYYLDWLNWEATMRDPEGNYFATLPTNLLVAAGASVQQAAEEGWEQRFRRHRRQAVALRQGLRALGLVPLAAEEVSSSTVTAMGVPEGVAPGDLRKEAAKEGVAIAGGLGAWAASAIRLGHMGAAGLPELLEGLAALEVGLQRLGHRVVPGAGVSALLASWESGQD